MTRMQSVFAHVYFELRLKIHLGADDDCTVDKFTIDKFSARRLRAGKARSLSLPHRLSCNNDQSIRCICRATGTNENYGRNDRRVYAGMFGQRANAGDRKHKTIPTAGSLALCLAKTSSLRPAPRRTSMPRTSSSPRGLDYRRGSKAGDTRWYARGCSRGTAGGLVLADIDFSDLRNVVAGWGRESIGGTRLSSPRPRSFNSQRDSKNLARPVLAAVCPYGGEAGRASLCTASNVNLALAMLPAVVFRTISTDRRGRRLGCQSSWARSISQNQADDNFIHRSRIFGIGSTAGGAYNRSDYGKILCRSTDRRRTKGDRLLATNRNFLNSETVDLWLTAIPRLLAFNAAGCFVPPKPRPRDGKLAFLNVSGAGVLLSGIKHVIQR